MNDVPQVCTQLDISATMIAPAVSAPLPLADASETTRLLRRLCAAAKASGMERDLYVLPTHCRLAASRFVAAGGRE